MKIEKMTYSYSAIREAIKQVKAIEWTVNKKADHFPKALEIKKLFEFCHDNINSFLFDPDCKGDYCYTYFQAAYNFKNYNKKSLDQMLKDCKHFIQWELNGILSDMQSGEVNTID